MYHTHLYAGNTSLDDGHRHGYEGETTAAQSGVPHVHYIYGHTAYADGHRHYYAIQTSPSIGIPGSSHHYHYIEGLTQISEGHYHFIRDNTTVDSIAGT